MRIIPVLLVAVACLSAGARLGVGESGTVKDNGNNIRLAGAAR